MSSWSASAPHASRKAAPITPSPKIAAASHSGGALPLRRATIAGIVIPVATTIGITWRRGCPEAGRAASRTGGGIRAIPRILWAVSGAAGAGFLPPRVGNNDEITVGWTVSPGPSRRRGALAMNLAWRQQARCRGVDPAVFYPVSDEDEALEAKEICATCPVRE